MIYQNNRQLFKKAQNSLNLKKKCVKYASALAYPEKIKTSQKAQKRGSINIFLYHL